MPEISVAIFKNYPIYTQLRLEEALLRADDRNWCLINYGSPPSIVMGISGRPEAFIDMQKWQSDPIPLIKRFSGGGTVFVDDQTIFITFICNASCTRVSPFPEQVMQWNQNHFAGLFDRPIFSLKENDYTIENKKFGGNAQYLTKKRWLQHTTLLWDFREESMAYLLHPQKTPEYRKHRTHKDFLCKLKDYLERPERIQEHILLSLSKLFIIHMENPAIVEKMVERPHRKSTEIMVKKKSCCEGSEKAPYQPSL